MEFEVSGACRCICWHALNSNCLDRSVCHFNDAHGCAHVGVILPVPLCVSLSHITAKKTLKLTVLITIGPGTRRSTNIVATVTYNYKGNPFSVPSNSFGVSTLVLCLASVWGKCAREYYPTNMRIFPPLFKNTAGCINHPDRAVNHDSPRREDCDIPAVC